jgi:hypothetical protein
MKYVQLVSLMIITVFSCQKSEEDPVIIEDSTYVRVTKLESIFEDNTFENVVFSYLPDGKVSQFVLSGTHRPGFSGTYGYSNNKLTSIQYSTGDIRTFTYSGDLIVLRTDGTQPVTSYEYLYNSSNQVTHLKSFIENVLECEEFFEFNSQGNIISHNNQCASQINEFEYDSNKNPNELIYPESYLRISSFTPNNNTILRLQGNIQNIAISNYQYNLEGYPSKVFHSISGNLWQTTEFTYETFILTP